MDRLEISVVIPTCNRKQRLLSLLHNLNRLTFLPAEVIIVDAGEDRLAPVEYATFPNLCIQYLYSEKSVCIQRNIGIRTAKSPWIFLCDDDIEMPPDYLQCLIAYVNDHPEAGAVSGEWLQKQNDQWAASYPVRSRGTLFWKFIFVQGIWGEIAVAGHNRIIKRIERYYQRKGNHISKAGWPVNTDFSSDIMYCPVYSLGASLVKKEWLLQSPYDEVLDRHGIGDNYGVIAGFPKPFVQVLHKTFIYHHHEPTNRLHSSLQYYRRLLALDYFIKIRKVPTHVRRTWLLWSLAGNLVMFFVRGNRAMSRATIKAMWQISIGNNQYIKAAQKNKKVVEMTL